MKKMLAMVLLGLIISMAIVGCGESAEPASAPAAEPARTSRLATTAPEADRTNSLAREARVTAEPEPAATEPPAAPADDAMEYDVMEEQAMSAEPAPVATRRPRSVPQATAASQGQAAAPSSTNFQDYARQRFVSASVDNVSTFSLDTDRTSYFLALNWAQAGYEVDPDSVRAEEWINAFDYGYEQPRRDDSFAITSDVITHPLYHGWHLARIAVQAPEPDYDATPVNVTLVLDASGSMSQGNRIDIAREAAESIRNSLRDHDRMAVVHFSSDVLQNLTVEHRRPDDNALGRSISALRPTGSTNVQAGLDEGVWLADWARRQNPDSYNYVILMSDGVANVDATDPFAILESAADYDSGNPLRIITIGVGIENFNDELLEQLAQHGNGWYRYLSDVDQARATFSRENWLALSIPFADQTRAQVTWDPDVVDTWRIVGYENRVTSDQSFTEARKEFAEIPAGAATTVFYELALKDPWHTGPLTLGDVELRWVTPASGDSNRQHAEIDTEDNMEFGWVDDDPLLRLGAAVALAADRYSSLPFADASDQSVHRELVDLVKHVRSLQGWLGNLSAYRDLEFLMEHITRNSREALEDSGYSR